MQAHGLWPTRFLCPWYFPGKNTRVGCHSYSRGGSRPRDRTRILHLLCPPSPAAHPGAPRRQLRPWQVKDSPKFLQASNTSLVPLPCAHHERSQVAPARQPSLSPQRDPQLIRERSQAPFPAGAGQKPNWQTMDKQLANKGRGVTWLPTLN